MKQRTKSFIGALTVAIGSFAAANCGQAAFAQESAADTEEEIIVTGSLLRRPVSEQSQLITTVGAEDLEQSGAGNAVEALASVAQNQPITVSAVNSGQGTGFGSFANLRSLGSSETLVLFNSKRVAVNAFQTRGVDLNTLPLNMIERVETLSDGASAVYGSDAIAGVINFIPRREMTGLTVSGTVFAPEAEGGARRSASLAGGVGSLREDGWNIYAGYAYHDKDNLVSHQRDFASRGIIPERGIVRLTAPTIANWVQTGTVASPQNPSAPACNPPINLHAPTVTGQGPNSCGLSLAHFGDIIPAQTDQSVLVHGAMRFGEHTATVEYFQAETDLTSIINPQGRNGFAMAPSGPGGSNPFYPGHVGYPAGAPALPAAFNPLANVQISWRTLPFGLLTVNPITTTDRILAELDGNVLGWDYEIFALRSTSTVDLNLTDGWFDTAAFNNGLTGAASAAFPGGTPFLNPFGAQSAAGAAFIESIKTRGLAQTAEATLDNYGIQFSRDLFELPAGPVQFAIAADYKEEGAEFRTTPAAVSSGAAVSAVTINGQRESYALTSEVNIPILEGLDLNLAVRHDNYSDFGSTTNPKVLISWQPVDALQLRASYNEGFRAPTLQNVFSPQSFNFAGVFNDPQFCTGGVLQPGGQGTDCATPLAQLSGGNPNIGAETSRAYSAGVLLQPTSTLSFGIDYWSYELAGTIDAISADTIFTDPTTFANLIFRCSEVPAQFAAVASIAARCEPGDLVGGHDPIAFIDRSVTNLGEIQTDGIDFTGHWDAPDTSWGHLSIDYRGTVVLSYDYQTRTNGPFFSRAGEYRDGFPVIDYSHYVAFTWDADLLTLQLANRYLAGYQDCTASTCTTTPATSPYHVEPYSLWDLSAMVHWPANATITGRVTNLLNEDPPLSTRTGSVASGYDERFTDPIGRAYSLTLRYEF